MSKCPPGVVCIENFSLFFIIVCVFILVYLVLFIHNQGQSQSHNQGQSNDREKIIIKESRVQQDVGLVPSWPYSNMPDDPLLNPYKPPLRDERYLIPATTRVPHGAVPINVSTNIGAVDTEYRQVGLLTSLNNKGKIIPLMGRPLFTNRDKWQYYTISNQNNSIKLPLSRNGRSCTNEYGCDRLFNGDNVYVEGINEPYKVTMYDNDTMKYLPFI
jgi:hypothetical protein